MGNLLSHVDKCQGSVILQIRNAIRQYVVDYLFVLLEFIVFTFEQLNLELPWWFKFVTLCLFTCDGENFILQLLFCFLNFFLFVIHRFGERLMEKLRCSIIRWNLRFYFICLEPKGLINTFKR
jgi:hypothetical protein